MTREQSVDSTRVRIVWLLTVVAVFVGYALVWQPKQQMLSAIDLHAHDLYEQANANENNVRQARKLRAIRARVESDLALLSGQSTSGRVTALALRLFDDEAKHHHVEVRTIVPDAVIDPQSQHAQSLLAAPVTVGLRGEFRDVVDLLEDLPRHNVLIGVRDVELSALDRASQVAKPALDAIIHTTIYRLSRPMLKEFHVTSVAR